MCHWHVSLCYKLRQLVTRSKRFLLTEVLPLYNLLTFEAIVNQSKFSILILYYVFCYFLVSIITEWQDGEDFRRSQCYLKIMIITLLPHAKYGFASVLFPFIVLKVRFPKNFTCASSVLSQTVRCWKGREESPSLGSTI